MQEVPEVEDYDGDDMICRITGESCRIKSPNPPCTCANCSQWQDENGVEIIWCVRLCGSIRDINFAICKTQERAGQIADGNEWREYAKLLNKAAKRSDEYFVTCMPMELLS